MNFSAIKPVTIENGTGCRVSLFVSGCRHHCKGCFQPETWDFNHGEHFSYKHMRKLIDLLEPYYIEGLSILGGEPCEPENVHRVKQICETVRHAYGDRKTIWLYTGYAYEDIKEKYPWLIKHVDVVVDGPFIEDQKDLMLDFRGSSNQRIIYVDR